MQLQQIVDLWLLHLDSQQPASMRLRNLLSALLERMTENIHPMPDGEDDPCHGIEWREFEATLERAEHISEADLARQVAKLTAKLLAA